MADIQVTLPLLSNKDPSKNKSPSSSTPRNSSPKRPHQESDTTKMLDSTSELPKKPSKAATSIRNAPSPATSPSEAKY
jgi:hypothetical protein